MPTRARSRASACLARACFAASLRSFGTSGRLRAASCSARLGVGAPLPAFVALGCCVVGVSASGAGVLVGFFATGVLGSVALKITGMTRAPSHRIHGCARSSTTEAIRAAVDAGFPATDRRPREPRAHPVRLLAGFDPAHVAESAEAVAELAARHRRVRARRGAPRARRGRRRSSASPPWSRAAPARNGRPTVLLYAHHDVQPPGKDEDWESPPFEPTLRGDRLYGRGAADDKAGVMAHVGAIRAFAEASRRLRPRHRRVHRGRGGVRRRARSRTSSREHRDLLAADAIIVADSGNWDLETPAHHGRRCAARSPSTCGSTRSRTPRTPACSGERCPMRCSPRSGCSTRCGTPTARSRSTGLRSARPRDPRVRRGAAARGDRPARRRHADRQRHDPLAHLGAAVDHGHGHRRPDRRERVQHAGAERARAGERPHRARPGRR